MTESAMKEGKWREKESNNHVKNEAKDVDMTESTMKEGKWRGKESNNHVINEARHVDMNESTMTMPKKKIAHLPLNTRPIASLSV